MKDFTSLSDEALVELYHQGDIAAMEHLCGKYRGLVSAQGRRFFLKGGEPQDVIQEGMIGLFKAIQEYDDSRKVPFCAFAELCINRQILKAIEAADRNKNIPLNNYMSLSDSQEESSADQEIANLLFAQVSSPEQMVIDAQDIKERIALIKMNLSPMERQVFECMVEGLDYHIIAQRLQKSEKSIDNAMQRIRQKVRKIL